jgi:hypothetical protein
VDIAGSLPVWPSAVSSPRPAQRRGASSGERDAERREAERQAEVIGRHADEVEVTRGEVAATGDR